MQETRDTWVLSLDWEDSLEEEMATYSSILAWKIPWTEEPGRPQSHKELGMTEQLSMHEAWQLVCWASFHVPLHIFKPIFLKSHWYSSMCFISTKIALDYFCCCLEIFCWCSVHSFIYITSVYWISTVFQVLLIWDWPGSSCPLNIHSFVGEKN